MADGRSTLDFFGRGFVLLRLGQAPPDAAGFVVAAQEVNLPLNVVDIADSEIAALYASKLVLVRPDGHVCWRADSAPSDAGRIVDIVRGA